MKAIHEVSPADVSRETVWKLRQELARWRWSFLAAVLMMAFMVFCRVAGW